MRTTDATLKLIQSGYSVGALQGRLQRPGEDGGPGSFQQEGTDFLKGGELDEVFLEGRGREGGREVVSDGGRKGRGGSKGETERRKEGGR